MLRQAYAMRLHRDPELVVPDASEVEKQARRKLWQAVFFQDTFLTVLLKLPPSATHSDVDLDALVDESDLQARGVNVFVGVNSRVENLMSISVIAPQEDTVAPPPLLPNWSLDAAADKADVEYIKSMWKLGTLVQEHLCSPAALSLPLFTNPRQKASLIASFRALHRSFTPALTTLDMAILQHWLPTKPRTVLQNLFMTSNYFHCLMLLQIGENEAAGVEMNVRATLEAAHEAVWAFIKLHRFFPLDSSVWWVFQHRAFEEAVRNPSLPGLRRPVRTSANLHTQLTIANLLSMLPSPDTSLQDAMYTKCKDDVFHLIEILQDDPNGSIEMQKTRLEALRGATEKMLV